MYKVTMYTTDNGNSPVADFIESAVEKYPNDLSKIHTHVKALETYGFRISDMISNSLRKLQDNLYELRPGRIRILLSYHSKTQEFVLLHAFRKNTGKTPKKDLDVAIKRLKDYNTNV